MLEYKPYAKFKKKLWEGVQSHFLVQSTQFFNNLRWLWNRVDNFF